MTLIAGFTGLCRHSGGDAEGGGGPRGGGAAPDVVGPQDVPEVIAEDGAAARPPLLEGWTDAEDEFPGLQLWMLHPVQFALGCIRTPKSNSGP